MAKTWEYRGRVIEEDFESWADPGRTLKCRTGYVIQAAGYPQHGNYVPGKFRTLAEAKRGVDEVLTKRSVVMEDSLLVSDANRALYLHDLDAETLRFLGDSLEEYADIARVEEKARGAAKLRHARSALIRLWADRFRTDANRLEDANASTQE